MTLSTIVAGVVVANIMSNPVMSPADVAHDVGRLFDTARTPTPLVVCATEIAPRRYKDIWRRTAREAGYRTAGLYSPNPIAVPKTSRVASVRVRFLSRGVAGISPRRTATVVRLEGPRPVVIVCAHLISRAWTHLERSTPLRRALWRTAARRLRGIVAYWHARGLPVVVAGDLNHPRPVTWAPVQRVLGNAGLMQVTVIPPAGQRIRAQAGRTVSAAKLYTDHPILRRGFTLAAAGTARAHTHGPRNTGSSEPAR